MVLSGLYLITNFNTWGPRGPWQRQFFFFLRGMESVSVPKPGEWGEGKGKSYREFLWWAAFCRIVKDWLIRSNSVRAHVQCEVVRTHTTAWISYPRSFRQEGLKIEGNSVHRKKKKMSFVNGLHPRRQARESATTLCAAGQKRTTTPYWAITLPPNVTKRDCIS